MMGWPLAEGEVRMQRLRWGVLGVGRFGRIHARALRSLPGVELAALCNRNPERLAAAAAEFQGVPAYADYRQFLGEARLDVVSITTHVRDHLPAALAALEAGRHVLLEKPLAGTRRECELLLAAAEHSPGLFMVGHVCRFDPRFSLAKRAVEEGRVGRIVSLHAKRNLPQAPGHIRLDKISPLMGDGIHDADLMMWFLGRPPTRVYGRTVRFGQHTYPDVGWAMLEFGDEAIGVIETNWGLPPNTPTVIDARMEVAGTDGMLTIDCSNTGLTVLDQHGPKMLDTDYWPEQHGTLVGALVNELAYFADCVRRGEKPSVVTPSEAARAVMVIEAAEQSAVRRQPVDLPPPEDATRPAP